MRIFKNPFILAAALLFHLLTASAQADETVAVIVHKDNPIVAMSIKDVQRIYKNRTLHWTTLGSIVMYDMLEDNPIRITFSDQILHMSASKVAERWAHLKITNQAINPPRTVKTERRMIKKVSRQKRAIGYVSQKYLKQAANPKVKVILLLHPQ